MFRLRDLLLSSVAVFAAAGDPPAGDPPADATPPAADGGDPAPAADEGGDTTPPVAEGDGEPGAGDGDPTPEPVAAKPDWRDKELGRKHAQLQEQKRRTAQLEQEAADLRALLERGGTPPAAGDPPARPAAPVSDDAAVQRAAQTIVAKNDYDRQCNDTFEKGAKAFGDKWTPALERIQVLGGLGDGPEGVEVMTGILATDDPAKVLFALGDSPDTFHRVMALPPARRQTELVKLAIPPAKKAAPKPSGAPAPVEPLTKRADARDDNFLYRDDVKDEDWYARRKAEKDRRWAAKNGRAA